MPTESTFFQIAVVCYRRGGMSTNYRRAGLRGQFLVRRGPVQFSSRSTSKVIAGIAVAHVELIANHGVPHGMRAEKQFAIFDRGVESGIQRDVRGTPAVPTGAMTRFGLQCGRLLGLLRNVIGRQGGTLAEEKILHVFRHELLRLFLPGHQSILVENHFHSLFP